MQTPSPPWTVEEKQLLKERVEAGVSFRNIALELGNKTRNACIGKARRMGLATPQPKCKSALARLPKKKPEPVWRKKIIKCEMDKRIDPPSEMKKIQVIELDPGNCHWPVNDPDKENFFFCGLEAAPKMVYCPYHCTVAYRPRPTRRI